MMNADPSQWNRLSSIEGFPSGPAKERTIVPGIVPVRQPLALLNGEYVCTGCGAVIERDSSGFYMRHDHGCSAVAAIAEDCRE
jgi:hypothetical protein